MRVVSISCVRNEEDIIEAFVRHTLAFCDQMLVLDHGSTDATQGILTSLQGEGLPVDVVIDKTLGRLQADHTNRLLKLAVTAHAADWILCLDADEFIDARDKAFLRLSADGRSTCLKIPTRTYYPHATDNICDVNPATRIKWRLENEPGRANMDAWKVIVPGHLAGLDGAYVSQGNHTLMISGRKAPAEPLASAWLAHFSLRTPSQYATKLASKYLQRLRRISSMGDEGAAYDACYARLRESYARFEEDFSRASVPYLPAHGLADLVLDPMRYCGGPLRYTPDCTGRDGFITHMLSLSEMLARTDGTAAPASAEANGRLLIEACHMLDGASTQYSVEANAAIETLITLPAGKGSRVRFFLQGEPGLVEIISIAHVDGNLRRTLDTAEMMNSLSPAGNSAAIYSMSVYRLLISREASVLDFKGQRDDQTRSSTLLEFKFRYDTRFIKPVLLSSEVLNDITSARGGLQAANDQVQKLRRELDAERALREQLQDCFRFRLGSTIDFSASGDARAYMREGWSTGEPWGTWTEGNRARLQINFDAESETEVRVKVFCRAHIEPPHLETKVRVLANEQHIGGWTLSAADLCWYEAGIPASCVRGTKLDLIFEIENPVTPSALSSSTDARLLGLGVASIIITSLPL